MLELTTRELRLGDTVVTMHGHQLVFKITPTEVWFYRPYPTCADFKMSAGPNALQVICYTGVEEYSVPLYRTHNDGYVWKVVSRKERWSECETPDEHRGSNAEFLMRQAA